MYDTVFKVIFLTMATFSLEQLNFFKFSSVVFDEFPIALRQVFVHMWDNQVAPTPGFQKWDDSPLVRNMFLSKEGGKTKYVPVSKSYHEWDCTALFEATLHAQSFAMPDGSGATSTLAKMYVKPRRLPSGTFHPNILSPSGNPAQTFALALDQLRLLRNTLCHQTSTQEIGKTTFDHYIQLTKDAFAALGLDTTRIDEIGKLEEEDFPTVRLQQLEEDLKREKDVDIKFQQMSDHLNQIESEIKTVRLDLRTSVTDVQTEVEEVRLDVKTAVTDVQTKVEEFRSDVKTAVTDVQMKVEEVRSDVKMAVTDVQTKVEEVGSDVKKAVMAVTDVQTKVGEVGSDVKTAVMAVTDVQTKVGEVRSDVKKAVTEVERKLENVESEVKIATTELAKVKADVDDVKLAVQSGVTKDFFVPDSSIPDEIPHFVGRDKACMTIEDNLTNSVTRLVNVWGPPGFGKTSVAIRVAHRLQKKNIPVYFASLRGMESKEDLVSKLLSMFVDDKQVGPISSSHFSIQCLQQVQNPFVLILDNGDDLLESGDAKRKEHVLHFIGEILTHCKQIKLLLTTRESLDYLNHKLPMHSEKIHALDKISSEDLVRLLLPDASNDDCNFIVRECGNVPILMRLMCSIIKEASISIDVLSQELNNSTLVGVLDKECLPDGVRIKSVIKTSFKRLMVRERDAFVSLSVFPEWFGLGEAQAILNEKSEVQTKQIILSLERKSLIDCGENFSHFTVHSLFRSFIQEEIKNDQAVEAVFRDSQIQFYDYYISCCKVANENFLKKRYGNAFRDFLDQRSSIISSLSSGPRIDRIYSKVVELLSEAKSFLSVALHDEQMLLERLYDTAIEKAKTKGNVVDKQRLQSARECHTAESFFWLSRVQREGGNEKGAQESARIASQLKKELLGRRPNRAVGFRDATYDVKGYSHILVKAFHKAKDVAKLLEGKVTLPSHYNNVPLIGESSKGYHEGHLGGLQDEAYMSLYLYGVHEETARRFLLLARKQFEARNLPGAIESVNVGILLCQELFGGHSKTASALFEKGQIHYALGDNKSAVEAFQKAADMIFNLQGYSERTAHYYFNLGTAQYKMQDLQGALKSLKRSGDMMSHLLHNNPEGAALTYYTLGEVQLDTGDLTGAMDSLQSAANIRLNLLGDHEVTASSYHLLGLVQRDMGDLERALDFLQKAANMRSNVLGDDKDTASSYHWFGLVQREMGDLKVALDSLQKAAIMRSKVLGNDEDTASSYHWFGLVQREMGDLKGALDSLQKAASMQSILLGDHKDTASSYYWLGLVQREMGDLKGALDSLQKAANMRSNVLGDDKGTASSYHWFGLVQREMGDLKGALDSLQKAANMRSNVFGDDKDTASSYHWFGLAQLDLGDLKGALDSLQKAANMRLNLLGDHEDTAYSYYWLCVVQMKAGDLKSALGSVQVSLRLRKNLLGDHPKTADTFYEQGTIHFAMGDFTSAVQALQKAAEMNFNLRRDHINTAHSYHNLGIAQKQIDDHEGAFDSLQKAICVLSNLLGDHKYTASSYHNLGLVQREMGDLKGAMDSLQRAANMRLNLLGDHEDTACSYHYLGLVQREMGDLKGGLDALEKATIIRSNVLGDNEDRAHSYHELGVSRDGIEDLEGALKLLEKAVDIRLNLLGDHHEDTKNSLKELCAVRNKLSLKRSNLRSKLLGKVLRGKNRNQNDDQL